MPASGTETGALGVWGEDLAREYLEHKGYKTIARNWRCKAGELDLVMFSPPAGGGVPEGRGGGSVLVFVEVRLRRRTTYGAGAETIAWQKQRKLIRAAQWYLASTHQQQLPARFDVVSITHEGGQNPEIEHIEHAFGVN